MSTPCILALGNRASWRGVPCNLDGSPSSTGPCVIDRVVRAKSVAAAATALVVDAPFGWVRAGGDPRPEPDEYLVGDGLSEASAPEVLDRHYALYLLDPEQGSLDVRIFPDDRWLDPVMFAADGSVKALPGWFPQPHPETAIKADAMPAEVRRRLQALCDEHRIRLAVSLDALRRWCAALVGDVGACQWLLLGNDNGSATCRRLGKIGGATVFTYDGADGVELTGSDGRLRRAAIDDMALAWRVFAQVAQSPRHAAAIGRTAVPLPTHAAHAIELLLSAAYEVGSAIRGARVFWLHGAKRWAFSSRDAADAAVLEEHVLAGFLGPLMAWLL